MKTTPLRLLVLLVCVIFSCEPEETKTDAGNESLTYRYITDHQMTSVNEYKIDFETYNTGDIVSEIFIADPFENFQVNGITMAFPNSNAAMIFDSSNPTGGDFDIGTPNEIYGGPGVGDGGANNNTAIGNVLILSEDLDSSDPDDIFEIGASFVFDFSANESVTLKSFDILDIEDSSNPTVITLFDIDENVLFTQEITPLGDNSKQTVDLDDTAGVAFMELIMNSSGAIDNITVDMETEEACDACESSITQLTFKYNASTPQAHVQVQTPEGALLFEGILDTNDEFTITGDQEGPIGTNIVLFIDDERIANLPTDCSLPLGPGFYLNGIEIVSGITETGGQLCPVEIF